MRRGVIQGGILIRGQVARGLGWRMYSRLKPNINNLKTEYNAPPRAGGRGAESRAEFRGVGNEDYI